MVLIDKQETRQLVRGCRMSTALGNLRGLLAYSFAVRPSRANHAESAQPLLITSVLLFESAVIDAV